MKISVLLLAVLLVPLSAAGQGQAVLQKDAVKLAAQRVADGSDSEPKLEIAVFPTDKHRTVSDGFDVYLAITNPGKADIKTREVAICMPRAMVDVVGPTLVRAFPELPPASGPLAKRAEPGLPDFTAVVCWNPAPKQDDLIITAGRQAFFHLTVPKVKPDLNQLLFRRDSYTLQVYYTYDAAHRTASPRIIKEERAVEFRPGLLAPLSGVVVGALLIALFIAVRREGARFNEALLKMEAWALAAAARGFLWTLSTTAFSGLVSGLILVILLNQTDTQQLPVTVSINDFWGGAFLGLISYKLADWLDEKFFSQAAKKVPEAPKAPEAPKTP
jgi:hypothetical protein